MRETQVEKLEEHEAERDFFCVVSDAFRVFARKTSVILGSAWAFVEWGTRWLSDQRIALSFMTWGFCLVMVFLRMSAGWRGRKAAVLAIAVLACSAATWAAHVGLRSLLFQ